MDEESGEEQVVEEEAVVEEETVEEVAPMPIEDDQEAGEAKEPVDDSEPTDVYGCPECGATFGLSATSCPGCGITFLDYGSETEPDSEMDSEE